MLEVTDKSLKHTVRLTTTKGDNEKQKLQSSLETS